MNRRRRLVLRRKSSPQCASNFDERSQSLSLARPAENRGLTISSSPSSNLSSRRGQDAPPLPSPAVSVASRADSIDGAPSLVSDSGSAFSVSPRLATSPVIELPPLDLSRQDSRRPSLPMVHSRQSNFLFDADSQAHAFSPRFQSDSKYTASALSPPLLYRRTDQQSAIPSSPQDYPHEPRAQLLTAPPTPKQLPPLQLPTWPERQEKLVERDSRMHLSSLLA
jgi:Myb-like DNA-binding protein FlbD